MKVLVGCEYSGIVSQAFRLAGHESYSCDIIPGDIPEYHFQADIFDTVSRFKPDLLIAHPPCTYLCKAQLWRCNKSPERLREQIKSVEFVKKILSLDVEKICVENPIGILSRALRPPDQIIFPWQFGDIHTKELCLWLKNLPPLIHTCYSSKRIPVANHVNSRMTQEQKSKIKSKFFPLVAAAMAAQWS